MPVRSLIIVPVDGSPETEATVAYATSIARARAADVHAVLVVPREEWLWAARPHDISLRARLRSMRTVAGGGGVSLRAVTVQGSPIPAMTAYARREGASLIVVGSTYGASRRWRATAVTTKLARVSPVPVVVVPKRAGTGALRSVKRIVVPIDASHASAVALRAAANLARTHDARVTMFHALETPNPVILTGGEAWRLMERVSRDASRIAGRLKRQALGLGVAVEEPVVVTGDPHRGILDAASSRAADLIVMGASPRSWFDRALFGSTLRSVLRRARIPVLVVPVCADAPASLEHLGELVRQLETAARAKGRHTIGRVGRPAA